MSNPETVIQQRLLLKFGALPGVRIWRCNTGKAWQPTTPAARLALKRLIDSMPGGFRPVTYGTPGQADVQGIQAPAGRGVAIEVKTDDGRLSTDQERWRDMWVKHGGLYVLAKGENAEAAVAEALRGGA